MSLLTGIEDVPFRPMCNMGCLLDIPTGSYVTGVHGESILNGGLGLVTAVAGRGNSFKTVISLFFLLTLLDRYIKTQALVYETEMSLTYLRIHTLAMQFLRLASLDLKDADRLLLTDRTLYSGEKYYELLKSIAAKKNENKKEYTYTTPFVDKDGKNVKMLIPTATMIDSFSQFVTNSVIKMQEKGEIGSSDRNTEGLRDAHAKNQLIVELPTFTASNGVYVVLTVHAGDDLQLDPYAPSKKKLAFMKNGIKLKNIPEKLTFLSANLWIVVSTSVLHNKDKLPEYPKHAQDDLVGDTDLMLITMTNTRGKSGGSGLPVELVVSQSEGVKVGLSEYHYIKTNDKFGIGGDDRNFYLDFYPDVKLTRKNIRGKIESDPLLKRALEITSELCQLFNYHTNVPHKLLCTPKTLFEDLRTRGFDTNALLNTRGYWLPEGETSKEALPFLSTLDLLRMREGTYVPYWMA